MVFLIQIQAGKAWYLSVYRLPASKSVRKRKMRELIYGKTLRFSYLHFYWPGCWTESVWSAGEGMNVDFAILK